MSLWCCLAHLSPQTYADVYKVNVAAAGEIIDLINALISASLSEVCVVKLARGRIHYIKVERNIQITINNVHLQGTRIPLYTSFNTVSSNFILIGVQWCCVVVLCCGFMLWYCVVVLCCVIVLWCCFEVLYVVLYYVMYVVLCYVMCWCVAL